MIFTFGNWKVQSQLSKVELRAAAAAGLSFPKKFA